eukprot:CAMPEP_0170478136 /NCGR_PEP_ID=MMETSP0123-20130129/19249_1 /TAXON_ID=182087 /ORGANISM="Favella ehrenbergii, Strain Fehren 1" /LENGTH=114 /DNA_ID=CAMNT_0010750269 /DNA_START=697 /DNA_END=1036 /DNA_ORIENTATION=-
MNQDDLGPEKKCPELARPRQQKSRPILLPSPSVIPKISSVFSSTLRQQEEHVYPDLPLAQRQVARVGEAALHEVHDHADEADEGQAEHCEAAVGQRGEQAHFAEPVALRRKRLL